LVELSKPEWILRTGTLMACRSVHQILHIVVLLDRNETTVGNRDSFLIASNMLFIFDTVDLQICLIFQFFILEPVDKDKKLELRVLD
jgi:hypothetical protein